MNNLTDVVKNLIIINVIIFLGTMALPIEYKSLGMLHFFKSEAFQPYQIITSMFMHADFMHLLFNMISLLFLGPYVEKGLGTKRFLILYLLAGFGATALHVGINAWEILWSTFQCVVGSIGFDCGWKLDLCTGNHCYSKSL